MEAARVTRSIVRLTRALDQASGQPATAGRGKDRREVTPQSQPQGISSALHVSHPFPLLQGVTTLRNSCAGAPGVQSICLVRLSTALIMTPVAR